MLLDSLSPKNEGRQIVLALFSSVLILCVPATRQSQTKHALLSRGGTLFVGSYSVDGFALAVDSKTGEGRTAQKLFQVGDFGAAGMEGDVTVEAHSGSGAVLRVDVPSILGDWLKLHPHADIDTANQEVVATITSRWKEFFGAYDPREAAGTFRFRLIFWGFVKGRPLYILNKFYVPAAKGQEPRIESNRQSPTVGIIWAWGSWMIQEELLGGNSSSLQSYKNDPAIRIVREAIITGKRESISRTQFLRAFDVILRAAESNEGIKFDANNSKVGPPNKFAVITPETGFMWVELP